MSNPKNFIKKQAYMDLRPGVPIVEICDNKRVLIENHNGITCYGDNEIFVKVDKGDVHVIGENLYLCRMNKTKLIISGRILSVHMHIGATHGYI